MGRRLCVQLRSVSGGCRSGGAAVITRMTVVILAVGLAGCSAIVDLRPVAAVRELAQAGGCEAVTVRQLDSTNDAEHTAAGWYRTEGCGRVAYFSCSDET